MGLRSLATATLEEASRVNLASANFPKRDYSAASAVWHRVFTSPEIKSLSFGPEIELNLIGHWSAIRRNLEQHGLARLQQENIRQAYFPRALTSKIHGEFLKYIAKESAEVASYLSDIEFNIARIRESHSANQQVNYFVELKTRRSPDNDRERNELSIEVSAEVFRKMEQRISERIVHKARLHEKGSVKIANGDKFPIMAHIDLPLGQVQWSNVLLGQKLPTRLAQRSDIVFIDIELPRFLAEMPLKHMTFSLRCLETAVLVPANRSQVKELLGWRNLAKTGMSAEVQELCHKLIRRGGRQLIAA